MRVAVLHNRKPDRLEKHVVEDMYEEYDSEETVCAVVAALRAAGVAPEPVLADPRMFERLDSGFDFVFNLAEGSGGRCREAVPAAVCELLSIPYSGSDPLTLAVTLDKPTARRIVSPDVPVARAAGGNEDLGLLRYPVVVKPAAEGSSKGIRQRSLCRDRAEAEEQSRWVRSIYGCSVLIEEFVPGAEVTVAVGGNGAALRILAMMEIAPVEGSPDSFLYSLEVKREFQTKVRYFNPPRLPDSTLDTLRRYALRAYELLGCRDIARMDFRLDASGEPVFLECNPLPGLDPDAGDLVIATRATMTYDALIGGILRDAAARYGIEV